MPVRQGLKDLYLALEVVEELRTKTSPTDGLDRYLPVCLLQMHSSDSKSTARVVLISRTS